MKARFFLLLIIPLFFFVTPITHVQAQTQDSGGGLIDKSIDFLGTYHPAAVAGKATAAKGLESLGNTILSSVVNFTLKFVAIAIGIISFVLSYFTTFLVGITSLFLDLTVDLSTNGFSQMMSDGVGRSIRDSWLIFRDLGNIGLIFILLYIAINTIIQAGSFQTKKLLGTTIMVAILINFSYFVTAVVIDVSNIMAISINESIDKKIDNGGAASLSDFIMQKAETEALIEKVKISTDIPSDAAEGGELSGVQQRLKSNEDTSDNTPGFWNEPIKWSVGYIMMVVLHIVIIITFGVASVMLITRIIILMFLLVLSPIGFVSMALPSTKKMSDEWWGALFNNAFFLPLFLLFVLVALTIIDGGGLDVLKNSSENARNPIQGSLKDTIGDIIGPLVQYSIVIGLFIAALVASKKMSMGGGGIASKVSGSITTSIGAGAFAAGGFAGRNTLGWGANKIAENESVQNVLGRSRLGMTALRGISGVAGSSFDARGSRAFKGVGSATGITNDFGKAGGKGGFSKAQKDGAKARFERNKNLLDNASPIDEAEAVALLNHFDDNGDAAGKMNTARANYESGRDGGVLTPEEVESLRKDAEKERKSYNEKLKTAIKKGARMKDARRRQGTWVLGGTNRKATKKIMDDLLKDKEDKRFDGIRTAFESSSNNNET